MNDASARSNGSHWFGEKDSPTVSRGAIAPDGRTIEGRWTIPGAPGGGYDWRLTRIDSIVRAILRAAAFELMELEDVPPRVVISEYIEVAHAFFEGDEPRVVNGVLDSLARKLRPGELPERG